MQSETQAIYELWEETPPVFRPHSRLYSLEPIEVGSLMVESLTSYISRLAEGHCVYPRVLLTDEVLPLLQRFYFNPEGHVKPAYLTSFWERSSVVLNGNCPSTINWVQALERLTLRHDLRFLTLLPFANVISTKKLLRRIRAWCPICYEHWREANLPIYDPLFWHLECITMCIEHKQELQQHCPYKDCARPLSPLTPRAQPGYCSWCNRWLGYVIAERSRRSMLNHEELKQQQWMRDMLDELFTAIPSTSELSYRDGFVASITAYVTNIMEGNISASAHQFQVHPQTLQEWLHNHSTPQLQNLLQVCSYLKISLLFLLTGKAVEIASTQSYILQENFIKEKPKKVSRKFDVKRIQCVLEETLCNPRYPPPSMKDIAKDLGYDQAHLSKRFPDLCRAISQQYVTYLADQRKQRVQKARGEVRKAMHVLHAQGRYPSCRQVGKLLGGVFKEAEIYATWQETLKELGWR